MKAIQAIKQKPWLSVCFAIFIAIVIFIMSHGAARITIDLLPESLQLDWLLQNIPMKIYMAVLSIVAILLFNKNSFQGYGFQKPRNTKYFKLVLTTFIGTYASMIIGGVVFMGILNHLFPTGNTKTFAEFGSIVEMIIAAWIVSSIGEEILFRGFVQGFIQHLKNIKILNLSLPVIISGVSFGCMHLVLITVGMNIWFVCLQLLFTTTIGLIAAYYREKSDSILPPYFGSCYWKYFWFFTRHFNDAFEIKYIYKSS
nr:type II CAAX endopeptidase family protein [uncultured Carboxylicivirga sp.]